MNLKKEHYSYIMMLGHLCADMSLFALSAAMPFLVVQKGMTMTATAGEAINDHPLCQITLICNQVQLPVTNNARYHIGIDKYLFQDI